MSACSTLPASGSIFLLSSFSRVVFPTPFPPSNPMRRPVVRLAVKFFKICLSPNDLLMFLILTSTLVFLLEALNSISVRDVCFLSFKSASSFIKLWASSILYFAFVLRALGPLLNHSISARTLLDITASSLFCCSM